MNANTGMKGVLNNASKGAYQLMQNQPLYTDSQGFLRCQICNKRATHNPYHDKPQLARLLGVDRDYKVWCICDCVKAQRDRMRQGIKDAETDVNRQKTFTGTKYAELTFDRDDSSNSYISQSLRKYSSSYKNKGDKWLLIYGERGVGKTFYAACVANRLISNGHSVLFKTAAEIEDKILSAKDKEQVFEEFKSHDVLVIDNLFAVDRRTDFTFKVMNRVVDDIYKSGKTLIVTATMTDAETGDPPDDRMKTVMSYIWEKGLPFKVTGKDRRQSWNAGNNN